MNLLSNIRFLSLWGGSLISGIGDAVISLTLTWTVYQQTGSPLLLSITLICLQLPRFIITPLLAVYLDRYPVVIFAMASNIMCGILFLFLTIVPLNSMFNFILFFSLITLSTSLEPMTNAASNIIITETIERDKLIAANSLMNIQFDLALSLGAVVGGSLVSFGLKEVAFVFNAITFFLAAILYFISMPPDSRNKRKVFESTKSTNTRFARWRQEFIEGFRFVFTTKILLAAVAANTFWNLFIWGTTGILTPLFTHDHLGTNAQGFGVLTFTLSLGIIIGSFIIGLRKVKKEHLGILVFLSMITHGIIYSLLYFSDGISTAIIILFISGIVSAPAIIYNRSLIQLVVPREYMGRVISAITAIGALGYPIGTTIAAYSVDFIGKNNAGKLFFIFGILTATSVSLIWLSTRKKLSLIPENVNKFN